MKLQPYNITDGPEVVNKDLHAAGAVITGELFTQFSYAELTVNIHNKEINFNYAYFPELNRYYFVDKIESRGDLHAVTFALDVLYTYKDQIKAAAGTLTQTTEPIFTNEYKQVYDPRPITKQVIFDDKLDHEGNIIMVTVRGGL